MSQNPLLRVPLPLAGLLALAVAMGIGRFAFTPILPIMQTDLGLSLAEGGWLASANYLGYMVGALIIVRLNWPGTRLLRIGLWLVVASTAAMGLGTQWNGWLSWRFIAGVASAWVFVGGSAVCIARLAAAGKSRQSGMVYSGVGGGIAFAGLACTALALLGQNSSRIWLWMGAAALIGLLGASMLWRTAPAAPEAPTATPATRPAGTRTERPEKLHWGLIWCSGIYGFGYILPATFLPAQTRLLIPDPLIFGITWPVFGVAAAISTLIAGRLTERFGHLQIWIWAQVIMAIGVFLPVIWNQLPALLLAAACVGGTLVVIAAASLQLAPIVCGPATVQRQMAATTALFALGQLTGPLLFSGLQTSLGTSLETALLLGAGLLAVGIWPLLRLRASLAGAQAAG